jgi:hypothetical protein
MTPLRGHDVRVTIRRLSIDTASADASAIQAADFAAAVQSALVERLGSERDDTQPREQSLSRTVAGAVASRIRPLMGSRHA